MGNVTKLGIIHIYLFIEYLLHVHYVPNFVQECTVITPESSLYLEMYKKLQLSNMVSVWQRELHSAITGQKCCSLQPGEQQRAMDTKVFLEDMKHDNWKYSTNLVPKFLISISLPF